MLTDVGRPPRDWFGLGRTARRVVAGMVLAGLLLVAGGVAVALRWDEIKAWADAPAVLEAHRAAEAMALPDGFADDPTLSACDPSMPVRCAWATAPAREAVAALREALAAAGLHPGDVVCDTGRLPQLWWGGKPECGAAVRLPGATLWALATATAPVGGVPLGRTAAWMMWDAPAMSDELFSRLRPELELPQAATDLTPDEAAAVVPERYRTVLAGACAGRRPGAVTAGSDAGCFPAFGSLDVSDLGADPLPGLVAELSDDGLMPLVGGSREEPLVQATRFFRDVDGSRQGVLVVVRRTSDGLQGEIWLW